LGAYLHPRPEDDDAYLRHRTKQAEEIEQIFKAFSPWETQSGNQTFTQHRRSLIDKAADVGILLLSQPSTYIFDWQPSAGIATNASNVSLVISPALWRTVDEHGRRLEHPHVLVAKVAIDI
jgi:hypothetical protein